MMRYCTPNKVTKKLIARTHPVSFIEFLRKLVVLNFGQSVAEVSVQNSLQSRDCDRIFPPETRAAEKKRKH